LVFFCSLFFGLAPQGGWFMNPPLTTAEYSPRINADFWLLGIGFIEISAIAGAIEIIVGVLRTRAPGMSLGRMPVCSSSTRRGCAGACRTRRSGAGRRFTIACPTRGWVIPTGRWPRRGTIGWGSSASRPTLLG
jgi:hypothetical protein